MTFLQNKYTKIYYSIINKAKLENRSKSQDVYYENHHIIPRSFGGTNDSENMVLLTGREHFVCHRLLVKISSGENKGKMKYALWIILHGNSYQESVTISSRLYERIKSDYANEVRKTKTGKRRPPCSEETKEKIRRSLKGKLLGKQKSAKWYEAHAKTHKGKNNQQRIAIREKVDK